MEWLKEPGTESYPERPEQERRIKELEEKVDALLNALAKVAGRKLGEEQERAIGQLRGHGHEHESRFGEPTLTRFLFALLVLGVFATYASTLGTLGTMYISSDGTFRWDYGFPLPWQTVVGFPVTVLCVPLKLMVPLLTPLV